MRRLALLTAAALATAATARPETRSGTFASAALGREISYVVDLPSGYEATPTKRYPVLYALHGLFEGPGFWQQRGLAAAAARLRESGALPDLVVVAGDGGNSFFVDGRTGRYQEMLTKDLLAHVESRYRVLPGRAGRVLFGVSMGGYAALRVAFAEPQVFAAVATHSAMLLKRAPTAEQGAGRWQMSAFHAVFGDPIDSDLWSRNDPLALARKADTKDLPALYFDCGSEDRYGLAVGNGALHRILEERGVAHTFALSPGDHGYDFVRSRIELSLGFLGRALRGTGRGGPASVPSSR